MIRVLSYIGLFLGLFVLGLLILWQGFDEIIELLSKSGFLLLTLPIVWLPSLIAAVISWYYLFPKKVIPPFNELFISLWIGRAINTILPVATIGGEIAKARLLILWGRPAVNVCASVLVDKIIGTALLISLAIDTELAITIILGTLLLSIGIIGFIVVQRAGIFSFFARMIGKFNNSSSWEGITLKANDVDILVKDIYNNKKRFIISISWRTLGLILQTTEVWLACYLLGHPISIIEALMLKSLTSIITDLAFIIPNGYGIQEGGYLILGGLIGLTPEFSLAVSLATRIREVIIDLPGLFCWQYIEMKYLHKKT